MAEALISAALTNLNSIISEEVYLLAGFNANLKKLSSTLTAIRAVLEDAEVRQVQDKSVRNWLDKLRNVAYDVDDILEDWKVESLRLHRNETRWIKKVRNMLSFRFLYVNFVLKHELGYKMKEINEKLVHIVEEKNRYQFHEIRSIDLRMGQETISRIEESEIYGRDEVKDQLVNKLLSEDAGESHITVMSIVGMGGIGKTTLAQLVYNDERVRTHFDKKSWAYVSKDFNVREIAKTMIEAVAEMQSYRMSLDRVDFETVQARLGRSLAAKRFLLVLDDVWNEDDAKWDVLKVILSAGAKGSKVIVTTRNEKVALTMGSVYVHHLDTLSDEYCWSIFKRRAFITCEVDDYNSLEGIGEKIVRKCHGVPLAIKTVASVLRFKRSERDWQALLESETWSSINVDTGILPALLLSYYNLPPQLKPCFAYCSIYPKDWRIEKDTMVKHWMAQGFIRQEGRREMEEIGGDYFDELLGRSLLQEAKVDEFGEIISCKMHDLIHDLAKYVANDECSSFNNEELNLSVEKCRHSSFNIRASEKYITDLLKENKLRTLVILKALNFRYGLENLFDHLRYLRVLDLSDCSIRILPSSIAKLKHLRCLDVSGAVIGELPESLSTLCYLQTLRLISCKLIKNLPKDLRKMTRLRHLEIQGTSVRCLPIGISDLLSLRTLTRFHVGGQGASKIGELKMLNLLGGRLEISDLEELQDMDEVKEVELHNKHHLDALTLCGSHKYCQRFGGRDVSVNDEEIQKMECIFEGLRPCTNIKELRIHEHVGHRLPSWLEDHQFTRLSKIMLQQCKCQQLPALGELPSLKHLSLHSMYDLRHIERNSKGPGGEFPKLLTLDMYDFPNLEDWKLSVENGDMPCLNTLKITYCHKFKALPTKLPDSLRKLKLVSCEQLTWEPSQPLHLEHLELEGTGIPSTIKATSLPNLRSFKIGGHEDVPLMLQNGLRHFQMLEILKIESSFKLYSLPADLQQLTALKRLEIKSCPFIRERYNKDVGAGWQKIAHIPNIVIDDVVIQGQNLFEDVVFMAKL